MQASEKAHFNSLCKQASFLHATGRYSESISYARKAMAIFPENPWPYGQIACSLGKMRNPEAPEWARKAIARDPSTGYWRACLSETYSIQRKWKHALEPMREAVGLSPREARFQSGLGHLLLHLNKLKEAIPYLLKAVELQPENADYRIRLSTALLKLGDEEGAEQHLSRALALKPDSWVVQNALGWRLRAKGDRRGADEAFREALRLNPHNEAAKVGLGEPARRGTDTIDHLLRLSITIGSVPNRPLFLMLQLFAFVGLVVWLAVLGSVLLSELISACFLIWIVYCSFVWQIVRVIGKWRAVHLF